MKVYKYGNINDKPRGWIQGKGQPKWHKAIFHMWYNMWERVYTNINYFGKTIQPEYKHLSKYVDDIMKLENFDLFKVNPKGWSIDKDIKNGTLYGYYFEFLSLTTVNENAKELYSRRGNPLSKDKAKIVGINNRKPIIALNKDGEPSLVFDSLDDAYNKGFNKGHISECCHGKRNTHGGFYWHRLNLTVL